MNTWVARPSPRFVAAIKSGMFNMLLLVTLGLAGCAGPDIVYLHKKLPPRSESPKWINSDPVMHGLEGWEEFGAFIFKGTDKDLLREAATLGAEAYSSMETTVGRRGTEKTRLSSEKYGSVRIDTYEVRAGTPTFSKKSYVSLYHRTRPNAQYAFENICRLYNLGPTDTEESVCDTKTLKKILELYPVDVNYQRVAGYGKEPTLLAYVVKKIAKELRSPTPEEKRYIYRYDWEVRGIRMRVADRFQMVSLLISKGANPSINTPIEFVNETLSHNTKINGDFLPTIHMFSNWRTGPPVKLGEDDSELIKKIRRERALESDMSPGERQAALLELKRALVKAGATE
jgi:hypothetical protein